MPRLSWPPPLLWRRSFRLACSLGIFMGARSHRFASVCVMRAREGGCLDALGRAAGPDPGRLLHDDLARGSSCPSVCNLRAKKSIEHTRKSSSSLASGCFSSSLLPSRSCLRCDPAPRCKDDESTGAASATNLRCLTIVCGLACVCACQTAFCKMPHKAQLQHPDSQLCGSWLTSISKRCASSLSSTKAPFITICSSAFGHNDRSSWSLELADTCRQPQQISRYRTCYDPELPSFLCQDQRSLPNNPCPPESSVPSAEGGVWLACPPTAAGCCSCA